MSVFNPQVVDTTKQYMFFGEELNVSRSDVNKFPIFDKLVDQQLGFFWRPEEVDVNKDRLDFKRLSTEHQRIFIKNISFQILMDSVQARSPGLAMLPIVSIPELESCIEAWSFFEMIHNRSYTYILKNVFPNPSEIFDNIMIDEDILERAEQIGKYYNDFIELLQQHKANPGSVPILKLKEAFLLCMVSINILEGINFYASFACAFAFAEHGFMEGNAKIISFIARDEALHLAITQNILKRWASGDDDPDMKKLFHKNIKVITKMFEMAVENERRWAKCLFSEGSMIGLSENILVTYVEYIAGKRMRNLGLKHSYPHKNPLAWTDKYLKSSDMQVAPQEVEVSSYIVGGIKKDLDSVDFSKYLSS